MNNVMRSFTRCVASVKWLWLTVVLVTALADLTFYRQPYGWLCGVFLLLVGVLLALRPAPASRVWVVALLVLAIAAGAIIYRGGVLAPCLALLALVAIAGARVDAGVRHAGAWAYAVLQVPLRLAGGLVRDLRLLRRRRSASRRAGASVSRVVLAWIVPLVLGLVFLYLFCLANPVIERGVDKILGTVADFIKWMKLPEVVRMFFWLVVAAGLWGFWRIRQGRAAQQAVPPPLPLLARPPEGEPALVWRCLGVFNVLFALETVTDLIYLWGGCALPEGMSYASYAHRGAYPLVVTALLSAGLTLYFFPPGRRAERDPVARLLVLAWLAQNVLLTASAIWRLHLYVDVYTLTRLRVAAFVWMGLVGFGLLAMGWRIARARDNRWLLDVNAVALITVLLGCAWWPMDGFIARHNVKFCQEAGGPGRRLDITYLQQLGPEAIPALRTYACWPAGRSKEAGHAADQLTEKLRQELVNPRAWTMRRGELARVGALSSSSAGLDNTHGGSGGPALPGMQP
ncbi:MAG: DUF4173 domain-containing protein [bacterium]